MKLNIDIPEKIFGLKTALVIIYVPILILVIVVIISLNLVILPKINETMAAWGGLKEIDNQRSLVLEKIRYLQSVDQTELKKSSVSINSALLPQKNAYLLVGIIRNIGDHFGFQIDSFTVNPGILSANDDKSSTKVVSGVSKIPVRMILVGPLKRYLELVKGLETSLPMLSLDSFKMQNDGDTAKLDLMISSYYIEGNVKVDLRKLSLDDLSLSKDESAVLSELSGFKAWGNDSGAIVAPIQKGFTNYNRADPFTP